MQLTSADALRLLDWYRCVCQGYRTDSHGSRSMAARLIIFLRHQGYPNDDLYVTDAHYRLQVASRDRRDVVAEAEAILRG